jgi:diguanylate cyclase (GGDEF)-like protein/PAS domain S-box-containing protein
MASLPIANLRAPRLADAHGNLPGPSEQAISRIQSLVTAAARGLGADGAAFVLHAPDGVVGTITHGHVLDLDVTEEPARAALSERLQVVERSEPGHPISGPLYDAKFRFFASSRIGTDATPCGYLAIYGADPRSLSGAQEYLLLTFAAQIADQLELDDLRSSSLEAERSHRKREERLRMLESVVVNANDSVLITEAEPIDAPGPRIVFANAAFTRTTGYELQEVLGLSPRILQGPGTNDTVRARLRAALIAWQPVEVELVNYRKDGTPFWVELSIVPVAGEDGIYTHWVSVQRDVTGRKASEEAATKTLITEAASAALAFRAFHDELTGLRNRAYLNDRVATLLERLHADNGQRFAILFIDLDRFKIVNDSLGHRVGDLLLVEIARRLEGCIRTKDTLARMGGDEFTCLVEAERLADVVAVAERILESLRAPIPLAGREIFASTSIGVAYVDETYRTASDVFRDADTAMYRAKNSGGMRYELFHESMHSDALAALRLQMDLRAAVDRNEFTVYYQPLVSLETGKAYGLEALVRWEHPENGVVSPSDFIPIAEETGLIVPIGTWVLREACRRTRIWQDASPENAKLTLSVNVSSRQLFDPRFFVELNDALSESELDPSTLQLEITESIFLSHEQDFTALLERIKGLGVRIALDDFGTGYSSLSYLERFRFDTIKIDQSFVARLLTTSATGEIVRLIIGLAGALGMEVVAEGVERSAKWAALREFGCARGQGYLFSRPVRETDVAALLVNPLAVLSEKLLV